MLAYIDFYLGGDEKRPDLLPPRLYQRFPMCVIFGGDGSYMAPFSLHSDNVLTSLMSQLRLVCRGHLKVTLAPVLSWLETLANPTLRVHGVRIDLASFQATALAYCQLGLVVHAVKEPEAIMVDAVASTIKINESPRAYNGHRDNRPDYLRAMEAVPLRKRINGEILDVCSLRLLKHRKNLFYPLSFVVHNTKPVGHQDLVGLVISILLLGDFSLVLLTLLQLYSFTMVDVFLVLFVLPLGILSPFPAGINALFSHGPRRSAGLARVYALWNITSLINVDNVFVQLLCSIQYRIIKESADDAFYELQNPKEQIQAYVFDVVRAHVPRMTLDELFEQKGDVAKAVLEELEKVMGAYGYNIEQILMVDIIPDPSVRKAMNEINAAQRLQLASVYKGEAEKILLVKKAEAEAKYLGGVGVAKQRQAITDGLREKILNFSHTVSGTNAKEVMDLIMVTHYSDTLKELGNSSKNTTVFIPQMLFW